MATALKNPDDRPASSAVAVVVAPRNDREPIKADYDGLDPQQVIVRDITIQAGTMLDFVYVTPVPNGPLDGDIQDVINRLQGAPAAARLFGAANLLEAAAVQPETPLDLNVAAPSYVVFRLSDAIVWRFNPSLPAISNKNAADNGCYGRLRHVGANGVASADPLPDAKIIYFVANPPPDGIGEQPVVQYVHGFNLEVELEQSPYPDGTRRVLPISIDPDIRNPGGST